MASRLVLGTHRSEALAERKLRQLERDNPGKEVEIFGRRDRNGAPSTHGHTFVFIIREAEKELDSLEDFFDAYDEAQENDEDFENEPWETSADYHNEFDH